MLGVGAQEEGVRRVVEKKTGWSLDYLKKKKIRRICQFSIYPASAVWGRDSRLQAN